MLEGVKVLSFTRYLQRPSAVQISADLGAEVVEVESPEGAYERSWSGCNTYPGGVSVFFPLGNHNQTSIAVGLKGKEGVEIIHKLLREYDVMIENFCAGAVEELGLGYEDLEKVNPSIIYCSYSDYGSSGPYVKKSGQGLLIQSMSGLISLTDSDPEAPSPVRTPVVDQHGTMLAVLGVVASICDRARAGKGHKMGTSFLGSTLDPQQEALGYYLNGGQFTERPATGFSTRFRQSPYSVYGTGDGCITLSLVPVEKLRGLLTPGCLDGYTSRNQVGRGLEFDAVVCREVEKKTTGEWKEIFDENGTWCAPVNNYQEVLEDEQVRYNDNILTMYHPVAVGVRVIGHASRYDGENTKVQKLPPRLRESAKTLVEHLGYNEGAIRKYREHDIITMKK